MFAALLPFVLAPLASGQAAAAQSAGLTQPEPSSPSGIVAAAPTGDWVTIAADDLLVMELAPDVAGHARRVVIQLMPAPFSQGWVANIRTLSRAHWWDGLSVNRVQDNYVAQWGDAEGESAHPKPLPGRLTVMTESDYALTLTAADRRHFADKAKQDKAKLLAAFRLAGAAKVRAISLAIPRDPYADETDQYRGWPVARDNRSYWPVHCYAMVGVGRNLSPDTGSGAELYAVIGHAPRHLDRNIALVGRVVEGIEYLSSLPRGTEATGVLRDQPPSGRRSGRCGWPASCRRGRDRVCNISRRRAPASRLMPTRAPTGMTRSSSGPPAVRMCAIFRCPCGRSRAEVEAK